MIMPKILFPCFADKKTEKGSQYSVLRKIEKIMSDY